jgi:hypothetical protein
MDGRRDREVDGWADVDKDRQTQLTRNFKKTVAYTINVSQS